MKWVAGAVAGLLVVGGFVVGARAEQARTEDLFIAVDAAAMTRPQTSDPGVLRERSVRVDASLLDIAQLAAGRWVTPTLLRAQLFEDVAFSAVVDHTGPTSAGYWISGAVTEPTPGEFTLVVNGRTIAGTVRTHSGDLYKIRTEDTGNTFVREIDASASLPRELSLRPRLGRTARPRPDPIQPVTVARAGRVQPVTAPAAAATNEADVAGGAEDGARIDFLSVWTPAATELYGGQDAIRAEIDLAVAEVNLAYANSGVIQRLNLVFATEIDYVPSRNDYVDLRRLQDPTDGYLDEVHAIRDRYAADLVTLEPGTNTQGAAFFRMEDPSTEFATHAFSSHAISGGAFAHEFGHIQGLAHDRYQTLQSTGDDLSEHKPHPYSFGYVNQAALEPGAPGGKGWFTIMAYNDQLLDAGVGSPASGAPRMRFSNPDQTYNGDPLGVPGDEPSSSTTGPADARRTLNETRAVVANFRVAPCLQERDRVHLQANNGQFFSAENNGGSTVRADSDTVGPWETFSLVDRNGGDCLESGDVAYFQTSDGFYLSQNYSELPYFLEATATLPSTDRVAFTMHRKNGDGAVRSGDFVTLNATWIGGWYMRAEGGGGGRLLLDSDADGPWETFRIIAVQD